MNAPHFVGQFARGLADYLRTLQRAADYAARVKPFHTRAFLKRLGLSDEIVSGLGWHTNSSVRLNARSMTTKLAAARDAPTKSTNASRARNLKTPVMPKPCPVLQKQKPMANSPLESKPIARIKPESPP